MDKQAPTSTVRRRVVDGLDGDQDLLPGPYLRSGRWQQSLG